MNLASLVLASITLLVQKYADYDREENYKKTLVELAPDLNFPRITTYDFIVVGGGTAGSLMAGRLSEKFKVLLLESGGNPVPATANPFLNSYVSTHPAINNIFSSVPQQHFNQENGGIVKSHTGRMLGGSGSHNGNFYNRGSPYDYNNFANITGDDGWLYRNVLKHFQRFERFIGKLVNERERIDYYAARGPLTVDSEMPSITPAWFESAKELGYNIGDPNGNQKEGFTPVAMSLKNGERESTYTAFVKPYQNSRSRLTVLTYSEVEEVLINSQKIAYGVLYRRHGIIQIAHASKEVIVCAGTISSPMLLMKSGIGPKEVLDKAQIPVVSNLKGVGKNFQDHGAVILHFTAKNPNTTLLQQLAEEDVETEIMKYQETKRRGFMTRMDVGPQAFIVSSRAERNSERYWPDLQIVFVQYPVIGKNQPQPLSLQIILNRMKSSGEIGFNTTAYLNGARDDLNLALIDFKLFSEPTDVEALIEGIQLGLRIMETTTPFRKMNVEYTETPPERCRSVPFRSQEYWRCYVSQRGYSWLHIVGTCSMGRKTDPMAVVDSKLRVRGVQRLRVVDASVMPRTTNANLNAGVMLVAEKASQDILNSYVPYYDEGFTSIPFNRL
ncbi:Glucose dehydrogenase [FAD, quinone] [Pseudolycoriella hygida]|uniref:Glucose dehydrogenase [FAD, quinone] n=1 Tax=Pseudolycoriella hygida TaxID=35572 RepID=A0A9Q0N7A8_9DIPT|nr:Glucose dehydrogenase [FAD, quinone] [Pseudolycoriella hygida]